MNKVRKYRMSILARVGAHKKKIAHKIVRPFNRVVVDDDMN